MNPTVYTPQLTSSAEPAPVIHPDCLPAPAHGIRWTIRAGERPFRVRVMREKGQPTKTRIFNTDTRRAVLKLTHRLERVTFPAPAVLFDLLTWTDPALDSAHTRDLSNLCWKLAETTAGFDLSLKAQSKPGCPQHVSVPLPLPADRAGAADVARTLLLLARGQVNPAVALDPATLARACRALATAER